MKKFQQSFSIQLTEDFCIWKMISTTIATLNKNSSKIVSVILLRGIQLASWENFISIYKSLHKWLNFSAETNFILYRIVNVYFNSWCLKAYL